MEGSGLAWLSGQLWVGVLRKVTFLVFPTLSIEGLERAGISTSGDMRIRTRLKLGFW